ncbi:restriction endonuclease subunit S [Aeromonas hydrophila]|uniref:restriction endonuclease subunit S n=1 Tax=Aeromonas hydrophila TaxID=644 RepID=UPI002B493A48|nr:restriction endonuclease subunit S [Aeromonas hydrophila]
MTASAIPETWFHITLGDVARVSSGMGFPQKYQGKQEGIYPVYKVGDISNAVINHKGKAFLAGNYVGELEAKELKGEVFSEGATLFAKIGEAIKLNRRAFVTRAGLADNNVMAVIPEKLISKQFIHYFMRTVDLTDASRSTTVPSIRKGDVECLPLNIPSQAEQKEIADRLDKLLAQVEATQARLARIPDIIKQFRQSVLAAAVSGKLTEDWRKDNPACTTRQLLKNHQSLPRPARWNSRSDSFIQGVNATAVGKPEKSSVPEWQWVPIVDVAKMESGHTPSRSKIEYWGGDVCWIGIKDANLNHTKTIFDTEQKTNALGLANSASRLLPKDTVCISRTASVGYVVKMGVPMATSQDFVNWVPSDVINPDWLKWLFVAEKESLFMFGKGSTHTTIYFPEWLSLHILLPHIAEQTEIVRRVEQLFAYADSIEQQAKAAKARVDKLTQAILAKAFRGELTADWRAANPHLISGDNSAAALLARIQAERATAKPRKRASKPTISPTSSGVTQ